MDSQTSQIVQSQEDLQSSICHEPSKETIYVNNDFHNQTEKMKSPRQWTPYVRPSNEPRYVLGLPSLPKQNWRIVGPNTIEEEVVVKSPSNEPIYVTIEKVVEETEESTLLDQSDSRKNIAINQSDSKINIANANDQEESDTQTITFFEEGFDLDQLNPRTQLVYSLICGVLLFVGMSMITTSMQNSDYDYKNDLTISIFLQIQGTVCVLLAITTPILHALFHCYYEKSILIARIIRNFALTILILEITVYFTLLFVVNTSAIISKWFIIFQQLWKLLFIQISI